MKTPSSSREFLEFYYQARTILHGGELRIAYHYSPKSVWNHHTYKGTGYDPKLDYNHRTVLASEVVIDFDHPETKENKRLFEEELLPKLQKGLYNFSAYTTGGKGIHVHLLFPELLKYDSVARKAIKTLFIKGLCKGFSKFLDYQLCGNHLVRLELTNNENTYNKKQKELLLWNDGFDFNSLPGWVLDDYELAVEEEKKIVMIPRTDKSIPDCVNYLLNEDFRSLGDGFKRASFGIASYLLGVGFDKGDVYNMLLKWDGYVNKQPFGKEAIKRLVDYHSTNPKHVGVKYIHNLLKELGKGDVCKTCFKKTGGKEEK